MDTDSNGSFSFGGVPNGTYTITPSLANAIFTPATQSVTVNNNTPQASFSAAVGYSITGTVTYSGSATGPIYLVAVGDGGVPMQGTSITGPGSFTINGVQPGNYTIVAWRDALGYGAPNASDPTSSAAADIGATGNLAGITVALTDPAPVAFNSALNPTLTVTTFDQGVVLSAQSLLDIFDTSSVFNDLGLAAEVATSYTAQWCADSACATVVGSQRFPATIGQGTNTWFLSGLSDSTAYYFRYQGVAGSATSSWSPVVGPVTPGQPAGSVTVTGTVTLPAASTHPLYIAFQNQAPNTPIYYMRIADPEASQSYSIQLPSGTYEYSAFVDQNNSGVEVNGDLQTAPGTNLPVLTVTDSPVTQNMTLVNGGESYVTWTTQNAQTVGASSNSTQQYSIQFEAIDGTKHLIGAELQSGPNAITKQDILRGFENPGFSFYSSINLYNTPQTNDSYSLVLTYSDGSQQTLSEKLTGVVGNFGANPSPAGVGTNLTPNFNWTNPAITDGIGYNYFLLYPTSLPSQSDTYFYWGGYLSSSVESITWGSNPFAGGPALPSSMIDGGAYKWLIATADSNGNGSNLLVYYDPGYTGVWLPSTNPSTLAATATVGQGYSGTITATGGKSPYTFTVYGPGDGLSSSISGGTVTISGTPLVVGQVTFEVNVQDSTGTFWWAVYTINVAN